MAHELPQYRQSVKKKLTWCVWVLFLLFGNVVWGLNYDKICGEIKQQSVSKKCPQIFDKNIS